MKVIGITGGSGSGKTTALRALESFGALVLDCDAIYHELLEGSEELVSKIGGRFEGVVSGGALDRKALGRIVFADRKALEDLNSITHSHVRREVERRLREWEIAGGEIAAVDAVALIESGFSDMCDVVVGVISPVDARVRRVMERDGLSEEYARLRIAAQPTDDFYRKNCDLTIENDCPTAEKFEEKCRAFFARLLEDLENA